MYVKKIISFCHILKKMHTKENWFLFSASRCICIYINIYIYIQLHIHLLINVSFKYFI